MAKTSRAVDDFLELSAALTGFDAVKLQGTGLVDTYYNEARDIVGERIFGRLLLTWTQIREQSPAQVRRKILSDDLLGPVARNILLMWYVGNWNQMPREWRQTYGASARDRTHVVSAKAYQEGLMWRAIGAHPPAAKSPGFGTWTAPPEGAEDIDDEWRAAPARRAKKTPTRTKARKRRRIRGK